MLAGTNDNPNVYKRYNDYILLIWQREEERVQRFVREGNEQHPDIAFTSKDITQDGTVPFMDVKLQLKSGKIRYDVYEKKSDSGGIIIPGDFAALNILSAKHSCNSIKEPRCCRRTGSRRKGV